jgi:AcrR family transcriptional regulator
MSTRVQLLEAAEHVVSTEGHARLSMRRLAQEVDLSPMAAYRHFSGRSELLDAVAEVGFRHLEAALAPSEQEAEPRARIEAMLASYADFALAEPQLFELLFLTERQGIRRFPEDFERQRSRSFRLLQQDVEAGMDAGTLRRDDSLETSLAIWSLGHGLLALQRVGRFGTDPTPFRALFHRSIRRLLDGFTG